MGRVPPAFVINLDRSPERLAAVRTRFAAVGIELVRFDMSDCPQNANDYQACAIGEVAFRSTDAVTPAVPEPGTWAMMLLGFGAIGFSLRGRRSGQVAQIAHTGDQRHRRRPHRRRAATSMSPPRRWRP